MTTGMNAGWCRIPSLYKAPQAQQQMPAAAEQLLEEDNEETPLAELPEMEKQPKLQRAGPSEAFSKLHIERSGPSGNFSKLYGLKVRAFAHDMSHSTNSTSSP